jgi:hypothetical protein
MPDTSIPATFIRLPSIAERKLGPDYSAPVRLDPRVLDQMQRTIQQLAAQYEQSLHSEIGDLLSMIIEATNGNLDIREKFYGIVHDVRGLAGTFGHPIVGKFAKSLCRYMETTTGIDPTIVRFHVEAMRDALEDSHPDEKLSDETLASLAHLIEVANRENNETARESEAG